MSLLLAPARSRPAPAEVETTTAPDDANPAKPAATDAGELAPGPSAAAPDDANPAEPAATDSGERAPDPSAAPLPDDAGRPNTGTDSSGHITGSTITITAAPPSSNSSWRTDTGTDPAPESTSPTPTSTSPTNTDTAPARPSRTDAVLAPETVSQDDLTPIKSSDVRTRNGSEGEDTGGDPVGTDPEPGPTDGTDPNRLDRADLIAARIEEAPAARIEEAPAARIEEAPAALGENPQARRGAERPVDPARVADDGSSPPASGDHDGEGRRGPEAASLTEETGAGQDSTEGAVAGSIVFGQTGGSWPSAGSRAAGPSSGEAVAMTVTLVEEILVASGGGAGDQELPTPQGSDLLAGIVAGDLAALERALSRVLDRLEGLGEDLSRLPERADLAAWLLGLAAAITAFEVQRRRLRDTPPRPLWVAEHVGAV